MTNPALAFFRALGIMVGGFLALLVGLVWGVATAVFVQLAHPAPGVVVERGGFHPVVEYMTADGDVRREQLSTLTWLEPGREVTVLYVRDGWHGAEHDSPVDLWVPPVCVAGMGVVGMGAGVVLLALAKPARRRRSSGPAP